MNAKPVRSWVMALRLVGVLLAAASCQGILGIETTRQNRAASGFAQGYDGCSEGDCSECLSRSHEDSCKGSTGYGNGYNGCAEGNCDQCLPSHEAFCQGEQGFGNGYEGCSDGECEDCLTGAHECLCEGFLPGCLIGLQPGGGSEGGAASVCEQNTSTEDCAGCICGSCESELTECINDSDCQAIFSCVTQNPCSPFPEVSGTCYTEEFCKAVTDEAGGHETPAYESMLDVFNCGVENECPCDVGPPAAPDTDGGCGDGGCTEPVDQCQAPECTGCGSVGQQCLCSGNSVDECLTTVLGGDDCETHFNDENDRCNSCACNSCASELLGCFDDPAGGCMTLAQCMHITGCTGNDCNMPDTCGDLLAGHGGTLGTSFQLATALVDCQIEQSCPCTRVDDNTERTCGEFSCAAYVDDADPTGPSLPACCFEQGGTEFCGLDVSGVLYATCEPKFQTGQVNAGCPSLTAPDRFPYNGAFLAGCCRPTNPPTCGYQDSITDLGCLPTSIFDGMSGGARECPN